MIKGIQIDVRNNIYPCPPPSVVRGKGILSRVEKGKVFTGFEEKRKFFQLLRKKGKCS